VLSSNCGLKNRQLGSRALGLMRVWLSYQGIIHGEKFVVWRWFVVCRGWLGARPHCLEPGLVCGTQGTRGTRARSLSRSCGAERSSDVSAGPDTFVGEVTLTELWLRVSLPRPSIGARRYAFTAFRLLSDRAPMRQFRS
jgi:hypothetical protein